MKTLHLLRHAKSSWDEPGLSDRERGLNKRGLRDAPRMGAALAGLVAPMPVVASTAKRAQMTLEGLCSSWPALAELEHRSEEELYTFSSSELCNWTAQQSDRVDALFLIGHNPAFTDTVNELAGEYQLNNLPTAGYVRLSLDIDQWGQLEQGVAVVEQSLFPKQLK